MKLTIALIGCSKTKSVTHPSGWAPARDLYCSDLFRKRVAHVESRNIPWFILSAKHGLIRPSTLVQDYDTVISDLCEVELAEWHLSVAKQLMSEIWNDFQIILSNIVVELHAGQEYCEPLASILNLCRVKVVKPVANLGIGQQLAYYKRGAA